MDLNNYRLIIVDEYSRLYLYTWESDKLHQDNLKEFSSIKGYDSSDIIDLVKSGNSIFYGEYDNAFDLFLGNDRNKTHNDVLLEIISMIDLKGIRKLKNGFINANMDDIYMENKVK